MKRYSLTHEFVDAIPSDPNEGTLYISIRYRTAVHRCACGCGAKVVTPIKPARWHLMFDGDSVSLKPSIGSWQRPCRSHYWIENNQVRWARRWTGEQIARGRDRDASSVQRYYASRAAGETPVGDAPPTEPSETPRVSRWRRLWRRLRHR